MFLGKMEQYKGYIVSEIDPLYGTVTFTNGEIIKTGDIVGDISEKDMQPHSDKRNNYFPF